MIDTTKTLRVAWNEPSGVAGTTIRRGLELTPDRRSATSDFIARGIAELHIAQATEGGTVLGRTQRGAMRSYDSEAGSLIHALRDAIDTHTPLGPSSSAADAMWARLSELRVSSHGLRIINGGEQAWASPEQSEAVRTAARAVLEHFGGSRFESANVL